MHRRRPDALRASSAKPRVAVPRSPEEVAAAVMVSAPDWTPSGSWYYFKNRDYGPTAFNTGSNGRYHDFATGSLYLGDSLETCAAEVARPDYARYQVDISGFNAPRVLDLVSLARLDATLAAQLLVPSASHGWEPTIHISRLAREQGFQGIVYPSQTHNGGQCLVYWADRAQITSGAFTALGCGQP